MNMKQSDQDYLVRQIRTQYTEKEHTELDELKALDRRVKGPVKVLACLFGSCAALVMGAGMSLVMTDIGQVVGLGEPMAPGIAMGAAGLLLACLTYPLYKRALTSRRRKYAQQIIALSDKLMEG